METGPSTAAASIKIDTPAEVVYDLVTDVARMGEWSPECVGADVPAGTTMTVGATFTGNNARGDARWSSPCVVVAAERPWLFAFTSGDPDAGTTWTFEVERIGERASRVTESFDSIPLRTPELAEQLSGRHAQLFADLHGTLAALKQVAERETES